MHLRYKSHGQTLASGFFPHRHKETAVTDSLKVEIETYSLKNENFMKHFPFVL